MGDGRWAMGDDVFVMLAPDGSLSYCVYAGGWLLKDSTAQTFTNGPGRDRR
jgi:hypothetical protein